MKQTTRTVKVIGITKEGYIYLQRKWYERRGIAMSNKHEERLKRNYIADLGNGWHGHYNGDMGFTCEEVKAMLTAQGLPYKETEDRETVDISI